MTFETSKITIKLIFVNFMGSSLKTFFKKLLVLQITNVQQFEITATETSKIELAYDVFMLKELV